MGHQRLPVERRACVPPALSQVETESEAESWPAITPIE